MSPSSRAYSNINKIQTFPVPQGPVCNLKDRGSGRFPPRLATSPSQSATSVVKHRPLPPSERRLVSQQPVSQQLANQSLTQPLAPRRRPIARLWQRLRFISVMPFSSRNGKKWKPRRPNRGRPEGTKGAGSR